MASSSTLASLLLLSLLFIEIHARESNFFSKVPNTVENFDAKETQIPDKVEPLTKEETPQEQEPNFIPQTQNNGYGLYGHESGQLPPSATKFTDPATRTGGKPFTTTANYNYNNYRSELPYKTESEEYYNDNNNNDDFQNSNSKLYEKSLYYNRDLYQGGRQNFGNVRFSRDDYTTTPLYNQQNNKNYNYNYNNNGGDNVERQGMSDTRFLENGKYYYDISYKPHHPQSRSSRSWNNDRGYFGNNGNTYEYSNTMEGYQNDESEFQQESNEFVP